MVGVMKAGCAYTPLTTSLPEQRMSYMLEVSGAKTILCDMETIEFISENIPCPKTVLTKQTAPFKPVLGRSTEDMIHILFTSGSTGQPKGVMIRHRAIANLMINIEKMYECIKGRVIFTSSPIFDVFMVESLIPIALGECIVMADVEEASLPWKLSDVIMKNGVTALFMTPSKLQSFMADEKFVSVLSRLQLLMSGGEVVSTQLMESLRTITKARIYNLYGPAETSVLVSLTDLTDMAYSSIGKPITNTRFYVLDKNFKHSMITSVGELYIAGECLSMGYVNRADLTGKAFLPDPFYPGQMMY
jgi:non-ribosomal peptide synthetase component F